MTIPPDETTQDATRRRRVRQAAVAFVLYLLGAVLFTYPLALDLSHAVTDVADPLLDSWALAWVAHQLSTDPGHLFDSNRFYPEKGTLALTDPMIAIALLVSPVQYAFENPILTLNIAMLLALAISGLGAFLLVRYLTESAAAGGVAGSIFAFNPYRLSHLAHVNLQAAGFIPLLFLSVSRYLERGRARDAAGVGVFLWLVCASCAYYGLLTWTVLVVAVPYEVWRTGAWKKSRRLLGLVLAVSVSGVAFLPLALPLMRLRSDMAVARPLHRLQRASARPRDYLRSGSHLHEAIGLEPPSNERTLFPGLLAVVLGAVAVAVALAGRRRRVAGLYLLMGSLACWASLGPRYGLYRWLHAWFPGISGLRVPPRYVIFVLLAVSVLAGLAADVLMRRLRGSRRGLAAAVLCLFPLVESYGGPNPYTEAPKIPAVYEWLAAQPGTTPIVELPLNWELHKNALFLYWSTSHFQPMANGYSTFVPPTFTEFTKTMSSFPDANSMESLRQLGFRFVILHRDLFLRSSAERLETAMSSEAGLVKVHDTPRAVVFEVLGTR
jgi:hypothetical protein